jgi:hypothetical protein
MRSDSALRNFAPVGRRCVVETVSSSDVVIVEVIAAGRLASFYRRRFMLAPGLCSGSVPAGSRLIWLDSPVDSSSCDAGGRFHGGSSISPVLQLTDPGARVRLTIILLAITATSVLVAARATRVPDPPERPLAVPASSSPDEQPPERSLVGTLDQVDAAATQIVVKTATGKQSFLLQSDATIRQGSKTIKASELGAHKGERVKVRFRETSGGVRHAEWIVVASPPPQKGKQRDN